MNQWLAYVEVHDEQHNIPEVEMFKTGEMISVVENFDNVEWLAAINPDKDIVDFLASSADNDKKHVLEWFSSFVHVKQV